MLDVAVSSLSFWVRSPRNRIFILHFSFRNFQFDSKSNFVEESLRRYRNFWPGSRSQFDTKSNFVEESLRRNRIFILHFSFRKFQFDSKSNFVEENLRRYRNFWPGSQSQFDTKSNFVETFRPVFFIQKKINLILNRIPLERVCLRRYRNLRPASFIRIFQFDSE